MDGPDDERLRFSRHVTGTSLFPAAGSVPRTFQSRSSERQFIEKFKTRPENRTIERGDAFSVLRHCDPDPVALPKRTTPSAAVHTAAAIRTEQRLRPPSVPHRPHIALLPEHRVSTEREDRRRRVPPYRDPVCGMTWPASCLFLY